MDFYAPRLPCRPIRQHGAGGANQQGELRHGEIVHRHTRRHVVISDRPLGRSARIFEQHALLLRVRTICVPRSRAVPEIGRFHLKAQPRHHVLKGQRAVLGCPFLVPVARRHLLTLQLSPTHEFSKLGVACSQSIGLPARHSLQHPFEISSWNDWLRWKWRGQVHGREPDARERSEWDGPWKSKSRKLDGWHADGGEREIDIWQAQGGNPGEPGWPRDVEESYVRPLDVWRIQEQPKAGEWKLHVGKARELDLRYLQLREDYVRVEQHLDGFQNPLRRLPEREGLQLWQERNSLDQRQIQVRQQRPTWHGAEAKEQSAELPAK
mmetsp:Transcript_107179/g.301653  ORF Transcript_107179/g.301653 Transcript_107179/m.301653 type:complete len:323 (-) Transcript_107179:876-1844(-)